MFDPALIDWLAKVSERMTARYHRGVMSIHPSVPLEDMFGQKLSPDRAARVAVTLDLAYRMNAGRN